MQIGNKKVKFRSADVKRIYFNSFPKNERMPFPMMVAMSKLWNTEFLGFYNSESDGSGTIFQNKGKVQSKKRRKEAAKKEK